MGNIEHELKFDVDPSFVLPAIDNVVTISERAVRLEAVYWDTPDRRLLARGITLRFRHASDESECGWTLKVAAASTQRDVVARHEINAAGAADAPPVELKNMLCVLVAPASLAPVATIVTERYLRRLGLDFATEGVECADDLVRSTVDGEPGPTFRQIEVELLDPGQRDLLRTVGKALRRSGLSPSAAGSKLAAVLGTAPPRPEPVSLARRPTVGAWVARSLTLTTQQLVDRDLPLRLGEDVEVVHEARVATRRLRALLRTLRPVLRAPAVDHLRAELRWLGAVFGAVRDADVKRVALIEAIDAVGGESATAAAEVVGRLDAQTTTGREQLHDALNGERYFALIDELARFAARPPFRKDRVALRPARDLARRVARRAWKKVTRRNAHLGPHPSDDELHQLRKDIKAARYAAEFASVVVPDATRLARALVEAQDHLGELHDAVVMKAWLSTDVTAWTPTAAFLVGELHYAASARRRRLRRAWPKTWKSVSHDRYRRWLD
jgi:CHAD domain-containing protein